MSIVKCVTPTRRLDGKDKPKMAIYVHLIPNTIGCIPSCFFIIINIIVHDAIKIIRFTEPIHIFLNTHCLRLNEVGVCVVIIFCLPHYTSYGSRRLSCVYTCGDRVNDLNRQIVHIIFQSRYTVEPLRLLRLRDFFFTITHCFSKCFFFSSSFGTFFFFSTCFSTIPNIDHKQLLKIIFRVHKSKIIQINGT